MDEHDNVLLEIWNRSRLNPAERCTKVTTVEHFDILSNMFLYLPSCLPPCLHLHSQFHTHSGMFYVIQKPKVTKVLLFVAPVVAQGVDAKGAHFVPCKTLPLFTSLILLILGARTLLGAPGPTTRNKDATRNN